MGCFFSPELYSRVALGILNKQPDRTGAATHVDGGNVRFLTVQTEVVEASREFA
jgi:hypothetical protein